MPSFTSIVSFLALSGAAVSAMNLSPALPRSLGKRDDVECSGSVYCPYGHTCMTGTDGVPGCCPDGETCSGPGAVQTIIATNTLKVEYTSFSTYVVVTTGIYTGVPEPTTTTTTTEEVSTTTEEESTTTPTTMTTMTTLTTSTTESSSTSCTTTTTEEEAEYTTITTTTTTEESESVPTPLYPTTNSTTVIGGNHTITTGHNNGTVSGPTSTPENSEGAASGMVVRMGLAGVVAAVVGLAVL